MKFAHPGRLWFLAVPLVMAFFFILVDSRLTPVDGPDPFHTKITDPAGQAASAPSNAETGLAPGTALHGNGNAVPSLVAPRSHTVSLAPVLSALNPAALSPAPTRSDPPGGSQPYASPPLDLNSPYPPPPTPVSFSAPVQFAAPPFTALQSTSPLTTATVVSASLLTEIFTATSQVSASLPSLQEFTAQIAGGESGALRGLYADGLLALRIVQQPQGEPAFISTEKDTATQFQTASPFGVVGLLAHNFLSGRDFLRLAPDQEIALVYGDQSIQRYRVAQIADFQRLNPADLTSDFLDLGLNQVQTAEQVFASFYQGSPHLTLQTCIQRDGNWSWGVRFIVAQAIPPSG